MPLYQYECEKCGERFDVRQKFVDSPLTVHENCGGVVHRLLSAPALQFKGSGFYITDYAKNSTSGPGNGPPKKNDSSANSNEKSDSGAKTASSDSKSSDNKSADSKSADKSADSKSSDNKRTDSKPVSSSDTK